MKKEIDGLVYFGDPPDCRHSWMTFGHKLKLWCWQPAYIGCIVIVLSRATANDLFSLKRLLSGLPYFSVRRSARLKLNVRVELPIERIGMFIASALNRSSLCISCRCDVPHCFFSVFHAHWERRSPSRCAFLRALPPLSVLNFMLSLLGVSRSP